MAVNPQAQIAAALAALAQPVNVPQAVSQVVQTLQQIQGRSPIVPTNMAAVSVTTEIFGQSPGRPLSQLSAPAAAALLAWNRAVQPAAVTLRRYTILEGSGQSATVGTVLLVRPQIRVTDAFGMPVQGVNVVFGVTGGNGQVAVRRAVGTNADGVASPGAWKLGGAPGLNTLVATVARNPVATFWAVAV